MGEHKHNQTAIAAKKGELPPKEKKSINRAEMRRLVHEYLCKNTGLGIIERQIGRSYYNG